MTMGAEKPPKTIERDPLDLLGTDQENAKILEKRRKAREREMTDLKKVLSLPEGRRFVWKLMSRAGIFQDPFNTNAMQMSRSCGMKSSGLDLLADVNECDVNAFAQMQREHISEAKSNKETQND